MKDVWDGKSFEHVRGWMRDIEEETRSGVNKILSGNKCDVSEEKRAITKARGQALADEFGIPFFETSAKASVNVEDAFMTIAGDIKTRLTRLTRLTGSKGAISAGGINLGTKAPREQSKCCSQDCVVQTLV